jgi:hypothetical protein
MSAVMVSLANHRGRGSRTPFDEARVTISITPL